MAGKAAGPTAKRSLTYPPGKVMGQKLVRAYAEGRADISPAGAGTNPHTSGTPEYTAWQDGYDNLAEAADQYETATP